MIRKRPPGRPVVLCPAPSDEGLHPGGVQFTSFFCRPWPWRCVQESLYNLTSRHLACVSSKMSMVSGLLSRFCCLSSWFARCRQGARLPAPDARFPARFGKAVPPPRGPRTLLRIAGASVRRVPGPRPTRWGGVCPTPAPHSFHCAALQEV